MTTPATMTDVVRYGVQYQRAVPVPPGMYYVVIDTEWGSATIDFVVR